MRQRTPREWWQVNDESAWVLPHFVTEWCATAPSEDAWLVEYISEQMTRVSAYNSLVAVGAWTRLRHRTKEQAAETVRKALAGEVDEEYADTRAWLRANLTDDAVKAATGRVAGCCSRLAEEMDFLLTSNFLRTDTPRVSGLLRDRDALESVFVMLSMAGVSAPGVGNTVQVWCADVDAGGSGRFHETLLQKHSDVLALPEMNHPHLRRVAEVASDLWWGKIARK